MAPKTRVCEETISAITKDGRPQTCWYNNRGSEDFEPHVGPSWKRKTGKNSLDRKGGSNWTLVKAGKETKESGVAGWGHVMADEVRSRPKSEPPF